MSLATETPPDAPSDHLPKPGFRGDIQGLRALAVALVVVYHAGFGFHGGFVGVDAFFVLSGFVIARRLRWEVATTGTVNIKEFLRRRIVRIMPAAALLTTVTLVLNSLLGPMLGRAEAIKTGVAATLINANNYLAFRGSDAGNYFDPTTELNPFLHMWSLSVEEQFYLVFPFLVMGTASVASRRGRSSDSALLGAFGIVLLCSFVASLVVIGRNQPIAFYLAPLRAWEFLAGAAIVWIEHIRWNRSRALLLGAAGLGLLIGSALLFREGGGFPGIYAVVPVVGTGLLIVGGSGDATPLRGILSHSLLGFVGRISYAWYLWHWPLIVFAKATFPDSTTAIVAAVALSFGLAAASTVWFEEPVRSRPWTMQQSIRVARACTAASLCAFLVGELVTQQTQNTDSMASFSETFRSSGPEEAICLSTLNPVAECARTVADPVGDVLLLGDSTALSMFPGMIEAAGLLERDLTLTYLHVCATSHVQIRLLGIDHSSCVNFWEDAMGDLAESPPDVVVVAIAIDRYITASTNTLRTSDGRWLSDADERAAVLGPALVETIAEISSHVDNVIFVGITPKFDEWQPAECSFARWSVDSLGCGTHKSWEQIGNDRSLALEIQNDIIGSTNVELLDLDEALCDELGCSATRGDDWVYMDYGHISADESARLGPLLASAIDDAASR